MSQENDSILFKNFLYIEAELNGIKENIIKLKEALSLHVEFKKDEVDKVSYLEKEVKNCLSENVVSIKKYKEISKSIEKSKNEITTYDSLINTANNQLLEEKNKLQKTEKMFDELKNKLTKPQGKVLQFKTP
jgi:chromosome segregation ATPase